MSTTMLAQTQMETVFRTAVGPDFPSIFGLLEPQRPSFSEMVHPFPAGVGLTPTIALVYAIVSTPVLS